MYISTEDARSDLLLSGGVYLLGPIVLTLLLQILRLDAVPVLGDLVRLLAPVALTVLVPFLLMRYRNESLAEYGLTPSGLGGLATGALVAAPLAAMALLADLGLGQGLPTPLLGLLRGGDLVAFLATLLAWTGVSLLVGYATVKARDAFRSDYRTVRSAVVEIGRILAIGGGFAAAVLFVGTVLPALGVLLWTVGAVAVPGVVLALQRGPSSVSRPALIAATVLLALDPLALSFNARAFVASLWFAALVGAVGLAIGVLTETRRSLMPALGVGLTLGLFFGLPLNVGMVL